MVISFQALAAITRIQLILLACQMLALPTLAQAPKKAAPDDLVVTAKIVRYSKSIHKGETRYMLHAEMMIRNTTDRNRAIAMMSCSWDDSWLISDERGFSEAFFITSCDKNYPGHFTIPAGESMVFNAPLILKNGHIAKPNDATAVMSFRLGFIDLTDADVSSGFQNKDSGKRVLEKMKKARFVYWSNQINNEIDLVTTRTIEGKQYPIYHLTNSSK